MDKKSFFHEHKIKICRILNKFWYVVWMKSGEDYENVAWHKKRFYDKNGKNRAEAGKIGEIMAT